MSSRLIARATAAVAVAWIAACRDTNPVPQSQAAQPAAPHVATLIASDTAPSVGDTVRVMVVLRLAGDVTVASFTARVAFDTTGLRWLADPGDGPRAFNAVGGELRAAGATTKGFDNGTLFTARFIVIQRGAMASLRLALDEVHDVGMRDVLNAIRVDGAIAQESP